MTAGRRTILPPSSTPLERAVDQAMPAWDGLADAFPAAAQGAPPAFGPWLAAEWNLAPFARYFASVDELLAQALPWLMERGSAASLRRALGWIGYSDVTTDETGPWLHLDLGRTVDEAQMQAIAHVVRASLPAHVAFYRVFHGYDLRPIVLDRGPALDAGMLDGYSGVMGSDGVMLSFSERRGSTLQAAPIGTPIRAATEIRISVSRYDDMPVLDAWRLDSRVLSGISGGFMELSTHVSDAPQPGGGTLITAEIPTFSSAWEAPPPVGWRIEEAVGIAPVPVHPPRHWGGPWGGPWRDHFQLISYEEP